MTDDSVNRGIVKAGAFTTVCGAVSSVPYVMGFTELQVELSRGLSRLEYSLELVMWQLVLLLQPFNPLLQRL